MPRISGPSESEGWQAVGVGPHRKVIMKFSIVVFPGSNCDHDAYHAAKHVLGQEAEFVWHKETTLKGADVVVLPGGFSHGDYLRTGAIARFSPVMARSSNSRAAGGPVLGICNGFQILCEAGLLPGAMLRNRDLKFHCEHVCDPRRADRHAVHVAWRRRDKSCGFRSRTAKATILRKPRSSRSSRFPGASSSDTATRRDRSRTSRIRTAP